MSFPGSLARQNRWGNEVPVKRAGGRIPKVGRNGKLVPRDNEIRRQRQQQKAKENRERSTRRQLLEQEQQETRIQSNTGRGRRRRDGMHTRLPRENLSPADKYYMEQIAMESKEIPTDSDSDDGDFDAELMRSNLSNPRPAVVPRTSRRRQPPIPKDTDSVKVFVITPCFASTLTKNISDLRLDEYARLCAVDSMVAFNECPLIARHMVHVSPATLSLDNCPIVEEELKKNLLAWMKVSDKICLYTDLGVSSFLTEVIKFATKNNIETEFRLLGDAWMESRELPIPGENENENEIVQELPTIDSTSSSASEEEVVLFDVFKTEKESEEEIKDETNTEIEEISGDEENGTTTRRRSRRRNTIVESD